MTNGSSKGWIGLELGHRNIVIAQMQRSRSLLRFAAACEVPRISTSGNGRYVDVSRQELAAARLLSGRLSGKAAACVLPLSVTELSHASLPPGEPHEQYTMVANQAGGALGGSHRQFDLWPSNLGGGAGSPGLVDVNIIAIDKVRAGTLAETLNAGGWDCQVLDGLPHAVARAATMAVPGDSESLLGALHLGYDESLFVLARAGVPVFTRQLRNAGMHRFISSVSDSLCLLEDEARHVLRDIGLPAVNGNRDGDSEMREVVAEILVDPLDEVAEELRRTLSYLATQGSNVVPQSVCALGEGAAIGSLSAHLAQKADISVWNWNLSRGQGAGDTTDVPAPLLAVPAALSSLAWES